MIENKAHLEEIVKKYLVKIFDPNSKPKDAISIFGNIIQSKTGGDFNYLYAHPLMIQWAVSSNCNLRCKHCFFAEEQYRYDSTNDLSTQQALDLIDEFEEMNVYHVSLTGGEPLLRKDIFEIIKKLKSKNIIVYIQTNGTLINEEISKKLSEILIPGVDIVQISLDGFNKETHEKIRGENTYDLAIQGIKNLITKNITTYSNCTVTSQNVKEIPDLYKMAQKLGIKNLYVTGFLSCGKSQDYLISDLKERLIMIDKLLEFEGPSTNIQLSVIKLYELVTQEIGLKYINEMLDVKTIDFTGCNIACQKHDKLYIIGNGNVYTCAASVEEEFCLGNVKEKSLVEIWENRLDNLLFQEKLYNNFPCKDCKYFAICKGGCPMNAYKQYGTVNAPDGRCLLGVELMKEINNQ